MIKDLYNKGKTVVSLEIFPPKKGQGTLESITGKLEEFSTLGPDFISVTYGAGGSTTGSTCDIATLVRQEYGIESLAHLTCLTATTDEVAATLDRLRDGGVENILALRGDYPAGTGARDYAAGDFRYARDLISFIQSRYGDAFSIGAACYPEGHPQARSLEADIENLKSKVDAGADFLISQLFYDNEQFYRFQEKVAKAGIKAPISAGIMPVVNVRQIHNIVTLCGATLPRKFLRIMDKYEDNPAALTEAGIMYAIDQIIDLVTSDVEGIHLYTMNRPDVSKKICANISNILKRG